MRPRSVFIVAVATVGWAGAAWAQPTGLPVTDRR
jgi:hypothetical protein